ncbi:MAG: lipoate--protein ligase [Bernardetiaceae bacterium]|nr:lipoate--protein ligase [Bernardetiaceae bacterium]
MYTLIDNEGIDNPFFNIALEEYAIQHFDADYHYFFAYRNKPVVVMGKNQNVFEEINSAYLEEHKIALTRRLSGGGTVYQDTGNVNYSFITPYQKSYITNFKAFTAPIIDYLHSLGAKARLTARNDIYIEEAKISGTAQCSRKPLMVSHGTLLFDSDLDKLITAITPTNADVSSQSLKSVRSKVTNIKEHIRNPMSIEAFHQGVIQAVCGESYPLRILSDKEKEAITVLAQEKYSQWEWQFGKSPACQIEKIFPCAAGTIALHLTLKKGAVIEQAELSLTHNTQKVYLDWLEPMYAKAFNKHSFDTYFPQKIARELLSEEEYKRFINHLLAT